MNISNIGQSTSSSKLHDGNILPSQDNKETTVTKTTTQSAKTIDLRNISLSEVNDLIKSGIDGGLLDRIPGRSILNENGEFNNGYQDNEKIDLIASIEGTIEFNKSIGESTDFAEIILEKYLSIQGTPYPKGVDVLA